MSARIANWRRLAGVLIGTGFSAAPWTAVWCLLLGLGAAVCSVTYTLGLKVTIDGALARSGSQIALGVVLVAVLFCASWLLAVIGGSENSMLTDRCNLALGVRIARLAASLPTLTHFEDRAMLRRLDAVTGGRRTLAAAPRQMIGLLGQALRAIGMVVLLALVYLPVLVVPLLALAPALADRRAAKVLQDADDSLAEDRRLLDELFSLATTASDARELRTYDITAALTARHHELAQRIRRRSVRAALVSALWEGLGWLVFAAGLVGAIVVLVLRAAHGQISPGSVVEAVTLMRRAQTQISRSTDTAGSFSSSLNSARELLWLEEVTFAYPGSGRDQREPVLGPLSVRLPAGASVAIVGDNGAGKTTLVKLLCGMYAPSSGQIRVDATDLAALDLAAWRERVSAAFQDFVRFQLPLQESVGVGDLAAIEDEPVVTGALARAGSATLAQELPHGLRTRVGTGFTGGRELSGGQWQRLALARGLMRTDPLLVVLDEPTAALDAPTEAALFDRYVAAARELGAAHGTITLLVSHRFSTVRAADLIIVLEHGRLLEVGSHDELMSAGGTYAELFALQARGYA